MRNVEEPRNTAFVTERFAWICSTVTYDSLPESVRDRTKLIVLDTFGAMLSASRPTFPGVSKLLDFVQAEGNAGPSSIVGLSLRTSPPNAALMNGYLGYAMDIESHHGHAVAHAAAAVLPAALATAQKQTSSGAEFLAAVALGIDVACRVSLAIGPNDLYHRGFHPTSVAGAFGAASAGGLLLGLDETQTERAMGLAAAQAGGLLAWASDETEESRPFNPGLAARNGITAAELASLGFGAPMSIFDQEAKYNVFRAWSLDGAGSPHLLVDGLGSSFAVDELIIKQYACCAFLHPSLDGLLAIMNEESVAANDIAEIHLHYPTSGAPIIDNNPLRSHRAQYILPLAAVRGGVRFEDVIQDHSNEDEIRQLSNRMTFIHDDELDQLYPERYTSIIRLVTNEGAEHERRVDWARGTPENPMEDEEILLKFMSLAGQRVDRAQCESLIAQVTSLETAQSLEDLSTVLTA